MLAATLVFSFLNENPSRGDPILGALGGGGTGWIWVNLEHFQGSNLDAFFGHWDMILFMLTKIELTILNTILNQQLFYLVQWGKNMYHYFI